MDQASDLASTFLRLRQAMASWIPGDLMAVADIKGAFSAFTGHPGFTLVPGTSAQSFRDLETRVMELVDDETQAAWCEAFSQLERQISFPKPSVATDAEPSPIPAEPEEPYPEGYFSMVIADPGLLSQLCDEVKEHLDLAQFSLVDLERDPGNAETVNRVFRSFHTLKSSAAFLGLKNLEEVAHVMEDLLVLVRDGKLPMSSSLTDVIFQGIGLLRDLAGVIESSAYQMAAMVEVFRHINIHPFIRGIRKILAEYQHKKLGEILLEAGLLNSESVERILDTQKSGGGRFGEIAIEQKLVEAQAIQVAVQRQASGPRKVTYVKVLNERLNSLIDMVGELVVNQSMLRQYLANPEAHKDAAERAVAQLETATTGIKNMVLSMGMVSVAEIYNKLRVIVRNTAAETGKLVTAEFFGEETELDRNVIEQIYDPLVHIVRNAIDHGLETPNQREAAGKSRIGKLTVRAEHRGNGIEMTIQEDGAGIDRSRVLAKAVARGLIEEAQASNLKDREILDLLFLPGFSTKEVATEISGRGVGLDVVRQNVDQVHGKVEIHSTVGEGTCFTIRIPLTLAIIDGFVTRVEETKYIFPFHLIEEIIVPRTEDLRSLEDGSRLILARGRHVPVIQAGVVFGHKDYQVGANLEGQVILLVGLGDRHYGIAVDAIIGKQEIVIKTLTEALDGIGLFSGGTIFGDGEIGFVVDVEEFIVHARKEGYENSDR